MKVAKIAIVITAFVFLVGLITMSSLYPLKYREYILTASQKFDIDPELIASVINAESSFRRHAVSKKGAVGLMQLLPTTAEWVVGHNDFDLTDPKTNIMIGVQYLRYLLDKFGDTKTALMAYNAGPGRVQTWNNESDIYPVTKRYVETVLHGQRFYRLRFRL